jgi:hypothetical protein
VITMPEQNQRRRTYGFQISASDIAVMIFCAIATAAFWLMIGSFSLVFAMALGHFFLFCNVFRIHRKWELIWAAAFVVNVFAWTAAGEFYWGRVLAIQLPITAFLIALEMTRPRYHGIGARRINARHIDAYLRGEVE